MRCLSFAVHCRLALNPTKLPATLQQDAESLGGLKAAPSRGITTGRLPISSESLRSATRSAPPFRRETRVTVRGDKVASEKGGGEEKAGGFGTGSSAWAQELVAPLSDGSAEVAEWLAKDVDELTEWFAGVVLEHQQSGPSGRRRRRGIESRRGGARGRLEIPCFSAERSGEDSQRAKRSSGTVSLQVRLEKPRKANCPRYHLDRVPLRLLCTYAGKGTEWLSTGTSTSSAAEGGGERDSSSRMTGPNPLAGVAQQLAAIVPPDLAAYLPTPAFNRFICGGREETPLCAQPGEVLVFKGQMLGEEDKQDKHDKQDEQGEGPEERAVWHRSPATREGDEPRLLLTMDIISSADG